MIICRNELRSKTRGLRKDSEPNESIILPPLHYENACDSFLFCTEFLSSFAEDIVGGGGRGRKKAGGDSSVLEEEPVCIYYYKQREEPSVLYARC